MRSTTLLSFLIAAPAALCAWTPSKLIVQGQSQQALEQEPSKAMNSWRWENCGFSTDVVQVESITLSPDPPQVGKDLTINAKGKVERKIEEGAYADVVVKLGVITLLKKQFDVCEEARSNNATIQCPVEADDYTVTQTVALPKEVPKAKFVVDVRGYTVDDSDMLCLKIFVDFTNRPFFSFLGSA